MKRRNNFIYLLFLILIIFIFIILGCSTNGETGSSQDNTQSTNNFTIPTKSITVDGDSSDWNSLSNYVADNINDDAGALDGTDLEYFKLAQDTTNLYFLFKLSDGNINQNVQYRIRFQSGDYQIKIDYNGTNWIVSLSDLGVTLKSYTIDYINVNTNIIEGKVLKSDIGNKNGKYLKIVTKDSSNDYDEVIGKYISGL